MPPLNDIHMVDAADGWGIANQGVVGALYRTTDGGRTWRHALWPPESAGNHPAFAFRGANSVWVASALGGTVIINHTDDGGQSWTQSHVIVTDQKGPVRAPVDPTLMSFADQLDGWMWVSDETSKAGESGGLWATTDGGLHWYLAATAGEGGPVDTVPLAGSKIGLTFTSATDGWLTLGGAAGQPAAFLYVTTDAGRHWSPRPLPGTVSGNVAGVTPVVAGNQLEGFKVLRYPGRQEMVAVLPPPGGTPWRAGQALTQSGPLSLAFVDVEHGFAVDGGQLPVTSDGGQTWRSVSSNHSLWGALVNFVSPTVGFALFMPRSGDELIVSRDGGHTWTRVA